MISRHWAMSSRHPLAAKWKSARSLAEIPQSLITEFWCQSEFWYHTTATNENPLLRIALLGPHKMMNDTLRPPFARATSISRQNDQSTPDIDHRFLRRIRILATHDGNEWESIAQNGIFYGRRRLWTTHLGLHWQKQWESCSETTRSTTEFDHRFLMRIRFWTPMAATNENP